MALSLITVAHFISLCGAQTLLPELMERLQSSEPGTIVGVLETANSVLKRCAAETDCTFRPALLPCNMT